MDLFQGYKLEKTEDGYAFVLFLNAHSTEFSDELGEMQEGKVEKIQESIMRYVKEKAPNLHVTIVKVMVGSLLVATIPLGMTPAKAFAAGTTSTTPQSISIIVDNQAVPMDIGAVVKDGITYVPLRAATDKIGATLWWNADSKTVGINKGDVKIAFVIGANSARVNGTTVSMTPSYIANDATMVPVQFLNDQLGAYVKWNPAEQTLVLSTVGISSGTTSLTHTVVAGDTLWSISKKYNVSIDTIKSLNNLTTDMIRIGQILKLKDTVVRPAPVTSWPAVTYVVQPGDYVSTLAKKFGVTTDSIFKYNYMSTNEWLDAGDKIAISGYAPRNYAVVPGEATAPARKGTLVDWFLDGQYVIKRGDVFTVVDVDSGKQFRVKMMGGYNHADVEPVTAADTAVMKELFTSWNWTPRAIVVYKDGMNIASSLSGMPHSFDTIGDNGVTGHFDLYMQNSRSHNTSDITTYILQHYAMVNKAAGK